MKAERVIGFLLLVVGVGLILWSAWSVYRVFTGQILPPKVIELADKPISVPISSSVPGMEVAPVELDFIPFETISRTTNMAIYLLLMGFLSVAGSRLANIGANLLRPVRVYLRESKVLEQAETEKSVTN